MTDMNRIFFRPLFYDALSGEFIPRSDELKRIHTLGRLSVASYQKGDVTEDSKLDTRTIQYVPSWASQVTVKTRWHVESCGDVLTRLSLVDTQGGKLSIYHSVEDDKLELFTNSAAHYLDFALGAALTSARQVITDSAQSFFGASE